MKILGIDISTRDVALTLICTNTMRILKTVKVEFPKGISIVEKIGIMDTDNSLTQLVLNEDFDKVYIENNLSTPLVTMAWTKYGYYHITGYLMGYFRAEIIELINNSIWKKALAYRTPTKALYETSKLLKQAKEVFAIEWVKEHFYKVDENIDSDNADAVLIAYGGYKNGTTTK